MSFPAGSLGKTQESEAIVADPDSAQLENPIRLQQPVPPLPSQQPGQVWFYPFGNPEMSVQSAVFSVQQDNAENRKLKTEQAPVEGHAAFPDREQLERALKVVGQVVEEDVAEAASQDDADGGIQEEVVQIVEGQGHLAAGSPGLDHEERRAQPEDVHESVPPDGDRAQSEQHGINVGIRQHGGPSYGGQGIFSSPSP